MSWGAICLVMFLPLFLQIRKRCIVARSDVTAFVSEKYAWFYCRTPCFVRDLTSRSLPTGEQKIIPGHQRNDIGKWIPSLMLIYS
ncbi:hypothetical protein HBH56_078320 [Parastagonospora nodorum]|uniref:Secreted protein n=1 Tax=Phaeosphaeria nodorum (strain SN15 / ATCC MYA-4574 / FGSC 10173) TaxID=321614 RepID=A0A7U2IBX3_PHANO|nr:hypothetical protein HBH56_078320 [Parastagonospora nodorum]QRD07009.1 hypothetical protein JI435_423910 [Parastagonospora nodorum SN15]KAH3923474.1 hypothetical protein HBH54_209630 [Parastagonospora nodorum]KAH3981944.1 hypothetical protein HBH51_045220 [Parastagonospora nodorum]KAH4069871.1 hypothetical protein HBH50_105590 [Parastagonospora nodorum]